MKMRKMMKLKFPMVIAALLLAGAAQAQDVIPEGAKFHPESEIDGSLQKGYLGTLAYRFYHSDGSGSFQGTEGASLGGASDSDGTNWSVACKRDSMTDRVHCHLYRGDLWVFVVSSGRAFVSVGSEHYPGSKASIRVDSGRVFESPARADGHFDAASSASIIKQLKEGKRYRTRFMKWPHRSWEEGEELALGFSQAFEYITWATKQGNAKPGKSAKR